MRRVRWNFWNFIRLSTHARCCEEDASALTDESLKRVCSGKDFVCKKVDSVRRRRFSYFQSGYVVATMARVDFWPSHAKGKNAFCESGNTFGWLPGDWPMFPFAIYTHILSTERAFAFACAHRLMYGGVRPNLLLRPPPTIEFWCQSYCPLALSLEEKNFWEFIQIYCPISASSADISGNSCTVREREHFRRSANQITVAKAAAAPSDINLFCVRR